MLIPDVVPLRILILEDDADDQTIITANLRRGLEKYGKVLGLLDMKLMHARSMAGARRELGSKHVDLILADLNLPDSNGPNTIEALRELVPNTPIVVVSAMEDLRTIFDTSIAGADDYLRKDEVDPERIVRVMLSAMLRRRLK